MPTGGYILNYRRERRALLTEVRIESQIDLLDTIWELNHAYKQSALGILDACSHDLRRVDRSRVLFAVSMSRALSRPHDLKGHCVVKMRRLSFPRKSVVNETP
jgi:hypothetical protein